MASQFKQAWSNTMGLVPTLSASAAQKFVKQAWRDIQEDQSSYWSFLKKEIFISTPAAVQAGQITLTDASTAAVATAAAKTALDAVAAKLPGRQVIINEANPYHTISSYNSTTGTITLNREWVGDTKLYNYVVSQAYLTVPVGFRNWVSVVDRVEEFQLSILDTRAQLDHIDPQRGLSDSPWALVALDYDLALGRPRYEWYPYPAVRREYVGLISTKPLAIDDTTILPDIITVDLIEMGAKVKAYEWAEAHRSKNSALAGADWRFLLQLAKGEFGTERKKAQVNDQAVYGNVFGQNYLRDQRYTRGARYLQEHDVPFGPLF